MFVMAGTCFVGRGWVINGLLSGYIWAPLAKVGFRLIEGWGAARERRGRPPPHEARGTYSAGLTLTPTPLRSSRTARTCSRT